MIRGAVLAVLALLTVLASGCSYRLGGVKPLGEPLRIVVSGNSTRLVRMQAYLQDEVATALESKLGWRISPNGSARLELSIAEERIDATGSDARAIASRWTITMGGQALLTSRRGNLTSPWSGTGYASGLVDEPEAIQAAARNAAALIATWLENEAEKWPAE
jgi:hypothetical protein